MDQIDCGFEHHKTIASLFWYVHVFDAKIPDEVSTWIGKMSEGSGLIKNCSSCTIVRWSSLDFLALESVQEEQVFLSWYSFRILIYSISLMS